MQYPAFEGGIGGGLCGAEQDVQHVGPGLPARIAEDERLEGTTEAHDLRPLEAGGGIAEEALHERQGIFHRGGRLLRGKPVQGDSEHLVAGGCEVPGTGEDRRE